MQTRFTEHQLTDPVIASADPILRSCVHYGFCTATCPTYILSRDENDGPRGRIDLIREMLEKGGPPDARTVHYLDRCLSCLGCMTTCAVRVDYMHLIDLARGHIETHHRRPLLERFSRAMIMAIIPHPTRLRFAMGLARLAKPVAGSLPRQIRAMIDMTPAVRTSAGAIVEPQVYPAEGVRRRRVALLPGCAQQALDRAINDATIRLLTRLGCDVVVPGGIGCCGALTLHMGNTGHGKRLARKVLRVLGRESAAGGLDALVVNAAGCGTTIKDYGHLFADDAETAATAERFSGLARDVTELVADLGLPEPRETRAYRVAYHDACSLRHGQRVTEQPRELLARAGYVVVSVPEGHICCGSAGTYNILQPDIAEVLGRRKADQLASTQADIAAMGNIGCLTQLRRHSEIPTVHTAELLDWATGGPMPPRLVGKNLHNPGPATGGTGQSATSNPDTPTGFW